MKPHREEPDAVIGLVRLCGGRRPALRPAGPIPESAKVSIAIPVLIFMTTLASPAASLWFKSGFEEGVALELSKRGGRIVGTDSATRRSWTGHFERIPALVGSNLGELGGIPEDINFSLVDGGDGRGRVLRMQVLNNSQPIAATRASFNLKFNKDFGFKQLYVRYRFKLDPKYKEAIAATKKWFQITEYKSVVQDGFRKTLAIHIEKDGDRYFPFVQFRDLEAGIKKGKTVKPIWRVENRAINMPFGEWFDTEMFLKLGKAGEGRFYYTINGRVVFDVRDKETMSTQPPMALDHWSIFKLYQDKEIIKWMQEHGGICQGWYDDLEIWDGIPTESEKIAARKS